MHKEKVKGGWADLFHLCVVDSTHDQLQCASSVIKKMILLWQLSYSIFKF